jgi:hypothetical protein
MPMPQSFCFTQGMIMFRDGTSRIHLRPQWQLSRDDLCAQLAPLDRYGLAEFSAAMVDGLRALATWSKGALCATLWSSTHCGPL